MWNPFRKSKPAPAIMDMTPEEKDIIHRFAAGHDSLRGEAIRIHRHYIPTLGVHGMHPEQNFMSEVDNPCPDLRLLAQYREVLLDK